MVRLKEKHDVIGAALTANFNSTMVRLKAELRANPEYAAFLFQFHYGTIKSIANFHG